MQDLTDLCNEYPEKIPVGPVSQFLGIDDASLRASIAQGRCPFGLSWQLGSRQGFAIDTMQFYMAMLGRFDYKLKAVDVI